MTKTVLERACCRVDLAGGTVDLWPLYLYAGGLELVHMGIDVWAEAQVSKSPARSFSVTIESADLELSKTFTSFEELGASLKLTARENPLRWVCRLAHAKLPPLKANWNIQTRSDAPPGSGLGGSSVLGIALAKALEKATLAPSKRSKPWTLQEEVRNLEAIEIEHPAGEQDYVPALFGGLLVFHLDATGKRIEALPAATARHLSDRLALIYTGKPHHSGLNNWQIFQEFHNRNESVRKSLFDIAATSKELAVALRKKDWKRIPELINQEWELRRRLSDAVDAEVLEDAWDFARNAGAIARKACGAGGGGCLLVYFDNPADKKAAEAKPLPAKSWRWLSASVAQPKR